jgi:2-oxoglutarate dehydrogenase E2 component (dihydrolipoamide succinyltransferase)
MSQSQSLEVPSLGESVTEATIGKWLKKEGDRVEQDETLVELETDKVTMEVNSPSAGTLIEIIKGEGETVSVGDIIGKVEEGEAKTAPSSKSEPSEEVKQKPESVEVSQPFDSSSMLSPAARKLVEDNDLDSSKIAATGKNGRITKEDVVSFIDGGPSKEETKPLIALDVPANQYKEDVSQQNPVTPGNGEREERVKMTRLRQTIAKRLKDAQNTAAILTSFNEVDMSRVMELRARVKDSFEKKHGVRLGFMSFFVKACIVALKEIPTVNAEVDGDEIIYKNHYDIGVAVSAPQGLMVPVLRGADAKSFAGIESEISELATQARDGKLSVEQMMGGTFTITNGGVFGSLMSTPILNPPQSAILGMHKIEKRPVVVNDQIAIRPMMYIALTYDHRIIDGREAVTFLVRVKECLEDPERLLLDM